MRQGNTYEQVSQQDSNGYFANGGYVDGSLFLDIRVEVALAREVDAHSAVLQQVCWNLILLSRNTTDDHIALGEAVLELPTRLLNNIVLLLPDALTTSELLHVGNVYAVYGRTVVGEQSGQWSAYNLASVDDSDGTSMQPVAV